MDSDDSDDYSDASFFGRIRRRHGDDDETASVFSRYDDETASVYDDESMFNVNLRRVADNDPRATALEGSGEYQEIENMTDQDWERLGRNIAGNGHLKILRLYGGALNDHKMSSLFRGLTKSYSINDMGLYRNGLSVAGVRSMVPFLKNACSDLQELDLEDNVIKSEGFNLLFRALRDSPIKELNCENCGIESIEIERNNFPKHLKTLDLDGNNINLDGCRGLAKLLQRGNSALTILGLSKSKIDDEGVAILVDALQNNTSLATLHLRGNDGISNQGQIMLLKLVNDISSVQATLQSNHTLTYISLNFNEEIQAHIDMATDINKSYESNPEKTGREKVIRTQLNSERRAKLAALQGVNRSLYSEIDPLHLPEVLSLIGGRHGQGELYAAVSLSIMTLLSTVNRKKCIQQERKYHEAKAAEHSAIIAKHAAIVAEHRAKLEELDNELGVIEAAEGGGEGNNEIEHRSNKRRRKWWWGLWGGA